MTNIVTSLKQGKNSEEIIHRLTQTRHFVSKQQKLDFELALRCLFECLEQDDDEKTLNNWMTQNLAGAVNRDDTKTVRRYIERGGDLHKDLEEGWKATMLHMAASSDATNCIRLLLKAGANPFAEDSYGKIPLETAFFAKSKAACRLLGMPEKENESQNESMQRISERVFYAELSLREAPYSIKGTKGLDYCFLSVNASDPPYVISNPNLLNTSTKLKVKPLSCLDKARIKKYIKMNLNLIEWKNKKEVKLVFDGVVIHSNKSDEWTWTGTAKKHYGYWFISYDGDEYVYLRKDSTTKKKTEGKTENKPNK
ncbi:ankyrin repeat domain-containing protein [Verrucomicrobiota bacterium]